MNRKLVLIIIVLTVPLVSCVQPAASPATTEPTPEPVATFEEAPAPSTSPGDV